MQGQSQQQAYDRGITIFSPDGRLYQVEYAREAVKRGTASVGVRTPDGVVLAANRQISSPLMERSSVEKIHKADDHVGVASAGHVADARQLIDLARRRAQGEQLRYGQEIGVETLTRSITDHIQEYTQTGGARPFGVALLVGGVEDGQPRLFETDPSGTDYEWQAAAVGGDRDVIQGYLEEEYREDLDIDAGIELAISALNEPEEESVAAEAVDVATITTEDESFSTVDDERLESIVAEIDTEESDE
ncbi:archaeal proteasome endopeptidase complex subunit alpha [Natrinema thermotolerans]|uniref:Proteasome subunit alpha n=1 Tax=Natrinema thermotolerans TaxID=121872 RepID=A0AAF0PD12_9EURY|nr:archaeal proteasome endopeptidase complex subunit alpha [Natrinema thermotolerans]QCC60194.1 proteasome endopeptidase complex, archaeal, alpha subunit [Natrinema thermotolerans]QCC61104.1 proteasome endopeptidase complex, archaeal, alpha subunit [Natrinema thermotolerans]WMT07209.1 archaeal proteasome endopeptidase complex subunit alpha [Natrinema thermotolerans]